MDEYVKLSDLLSNRYIKAERQDFVNGEVIKYYDIIGERRYIEYDEIKDLSTIEIIRCKDCKYHKGLNCPIMKYKFTHDNDFCSYAERKDENG